MDYEYYYDKLDTGSNLDDFESSLKDYILSEEFEDTNLFETEEEFFAVREKVLASWKTGNDDELQLDKAIKYFI